MNFVYALLRSFLPLGRLITRVVLVTLVVTAVLFGTILKAAWAACKSR
jgi:hypothetical protein